MCSAAAPALRTVLVACADQRADHTHVLGLEPGDAAVVRSASGRVTPSTLQAIAMMATVVAQEGHSGGFELTIMHDTDCGVSRLARHQVLLASYFGVPARELPAKHVTEPFAAARADVNALRANGDPARRSPRLGPRLRREDRPARRGRRAGSAARSDALTLGVPKASKPPCAVRRHQRRVAATWPSFVATWMEDLAARRSGASCSTST